MNRVFKARVGMRVILDHECENTRRVFGLDTGMKYYKGTSQIISYVDSDGDCIRFEDVEYNWHIKDLKLDVEGIPEVVLQGEKQQFDINELT